MEAMLLNFAVESFTEPLRTAQMEYDLSCTDFVESVTQALEVYECAYLLGQFEAVQEESTGLSAPHSSSSSNNESSSSSENKAKKKAKDGFFTKLVTFVNKILEKLKHVASIIFDKIKKFFAIIKKVANMAGHVMVGKKPKTFNNGFTIDFGKGVERFDQFSKGYVDLAEYVDKFFLDFLKSYKNDDDFKEFAERRKDDIEKLGSLGVKDHINMYVKSDVMIGDDNKEWAEKLFDYKFMGEEWMPSVEQCVKMAQSCIAASKWDSTLLSLSKRMILDYGVTRFEELRNNLIKIQNMMEQINPTKASVLSKLVNVAANYSNTGVALMTTAVDFFVNKLNTMIGYLVSAGYLYKKES